MSIPPTWPEIRADYEERAEYSRFARSLLDLIKHVETTKLARGLYGWPSLMGLYITQTPIPPPMEGPHLLISAKDDRTFEFRYVDTAIQTKQWHRDVPASEAVPRLEKFLKQLHWFSDL